MKILDVRAIPLSYWCEQPYMSAAGEQVARNTLDSKGSAEVARALETPIAGYETEVGARGLVN
jgi:hypothetical protein